ncbi:serine hydrolase [uncultured Limosilactobacillus sp.]|uniref:serine hydrolase n=1 Tax=uncultured Limosilactobacillus sp. TaxID=2837629 RepID=UPI0025F5FC55|nr:serine hydrolase [uncultured Limosilactobacillus sp.]
MPKPSRREFRRRQQKAVHQKTITVSLIFIGLAIFLNVGLMFQSHNPLFQERNANPVNLVPNLFHSTSLSSQLRHQWKTDLKGESANVAIAVYSTKTGETYTYNTTPGHQYHTASTVKVAVLAGTLLKNDGDLDDQGREYAKAMIESSDNDSTTALINNYLGGSDGLQDTFNQFQMTNTHAKDAWGMTTTTPSDQIKLLNNIFFSSNKLTKTEQKYIRSLMNNVESDQRWGISAGSNDYALKNGWLDQDGSDKWIVNSIGYISGQHQNDYTIAVYTDDNSSMNSGEELIEKLARSTKQIMDK